LLPNDVTYLRFYDDEREIPPVPLKRLEQTCTHITRLAMTVHGALGYQWDTLGSVEFVAPPRAGCLEFLLVPTLTGNIAANANEYRDVAGQIVKGLAELAVLWPVVFGSRSVLDYMTRRLRETKLLPPPPPPSSDQEIFVAIAQTAARDTEVMRTVREIAVELGTFGFSKITIQVNDGPELPLSDRKYDPTAYATRPSLLPPLVVGERYTATIPGPVPSSFTARINDMAASAILLYTEHGYIVAFLHGNFGPRDPGKQLRFTGEIVAKPKLTDNNEMHKLRNEINAYIDIDRWAFV
jgi:hypothetical protein